MRLYFLLVVIGVLSSAMACKKSDPLPGDLEHIPYDPSSYTFPELPYFFPPVPVPADNPMTIEGVELGRFLFYDPILSIDSTISCASCHLMEKAFADDSVLSLGVDGKEGMRNTMSLANVAYYQNGLFWDGRSPNLEDQSLHPIQDPLEMGNTFEALEENLQKHLDYPERFRAAFGINDRKRVAY